MKTLLLLVGLLLTWENGRVLGDQMVSDTELQEMSTEGSKYINKEIKNALKGVKQIKTLIEQTNEERKSLLSNLEEAKKKKEVRRSQLTAPPPPPPEFPCWRGVVIALLVPCWVVMVTLSPFRLVSADAGAVVKKRGKVSLLLKASRG